MSTTVSDAILGLQDISVRFGAQPVVEGVSLTVHEGDRIGLIGPNGTGKSTLMKVMAGAIEPASGTVTRRRGLRVAMMGQRCPYPNEQTVGAVLAEATQGVRDRLARYEQGTRELAAVADGGKRRALAADLEALQHELEIEDAWALDQQIDRLRQALHVPGDDRPLGSLSGGERRRLHLAATVLQHPDLLLLDEPTNHVDVETIEWIEAFLAGYRGSCVLVTHDRYFLERIVTRIAELEFGVLRSYPGNYEAYLERKALLQLQEVREEANRRAYLRRELVWLRRMPKARGTKAKARVDQIVEKADQAPPPRPKEIEFLVPPAKRLGKRVLEAEGVSRAIEGRMLFRGVDLILQKGMRVGLVGPNGSGKTTLLRVLMGQETPDSGKVRHGDTTEFLYVDQQHEEVNPDQPVLGFMAGGATEVEVDGRRIYVPAYLENFLFDRSVIHMAMGKLSGGERNRLDLAKKLMQGGNVLVLDEPTNDLDLATLRVVEEIVDAFEGCALLVSHDRYFLNRLCTHILALESGGQTTLVAGNYADWVRYKAERDQDSTRAASKVKPKAERPAKAEGGRRLSYHEKRELAGIEPAIEAAEARVAGLESAVADPGFYSQPFETVQAGLAALESAKAELDGLYARWAELEEIASAQ